MSNFEATFEQAIKNHELPGAILAATNKTGTFQYAKSFGPLSLQAKQGSSDADHPIMPLNAVMWLASCTKLMTTICAMQCVERGYFALDDDVTQRFLPELKSLQVLRGFDGRGKPVLEVNDTPITLRQLLTHTSGLGYDIFNPDLTRWRAHRNETPQFGGNYKLHDAYLTPLLFPPGTGWEYSSGIDWAGQMVERASNLNLQDYMQKYIWTPLGMKNFTFRIHEHPDLKAMIPAMSVRDAGLTVFGTTDNPLAEVVYSEDPVWGGGGMVDYHGGAGAYGPPIEYQKILHSILRDDGKLLTSATINEMFTPQLTDASRAMLTDKLRIKELNNIMGGFPQDAKVDWGIGGMMNLEDLPSGRKGGSLAWIGLPNLRWWVDREGGLAGIYASQMMPPGDPRTVELQNAWESELYLSCGRVGTP